MSPHSIMSRTSLPTFSVILLFVTTNDLANAQPPRPPRLGIAVVDVPGGKRIVDFEADSPIRQKLLVGDVIVGARATTEGIRFRMDNQRGLWDLRVALHGGQNVLLTVRRPDNPQAPSSYQELEILLEPADLVRPQAEPRPEFREGWAYTQVPAAREVYAVEAEPEAPVDGAAIVQVFYATDRALNDGQYTGERDRSASGPLKFGICKVSIPPDHRIGEIEGPKWWRFEFRPNPLHHVVITSVAEMPENQFFQLISQAVATESPDVRRALVFVHGYNVDFGEAARRTAQMHYDLNFPGVSLLYSWPSNGSFAGYLSDAGDIEWSTPHIERFLAALEARSDIDEIYVVGHSMGNRGLTRALVSLANQGQGRKIKEIILAAPDIDAEIFERDIAGPLAGGFERTTVYASSNDRALQASNSASESQRAGEMIGGFPTISPQQKIEVIDASAIETGFLGHSYYGDEDSLIADMFNLVRNHQQAKNRARLREINWTRGPFYRFVP